MPKPVRKLLNCFSFGKELIATKDLDPVYVLLWGAQLPEKQLQKWLLAYWCFYHIGTASWIVDGDYWERMQTAAESKAYPRSSERRHFRGKNAYKSVAYLKEEGLNNLFQPLWAVESTAAKVMKEVQQWRAFGPWIAFKVADMLERLEIAHIHFDTADVVLFDSPQKGAQLLRESLGEAISDERVASWAIERILASPLGGMKAPPRYERGINAQEAETILCKWKSYLNGHYRIGEDIEACQNGLQRFPKSKTAKQLIVAGQEGGLW